MDMVLERLGELERKVREALGELAQARAEREGLLAKVESLQGELTSRDQEVATLRAEREREASEATRLRTEREEVRTKVEGLLTEIGRLESAVQGAATEEGRGMTTDDRGADVEIFGERYTLRSGDAPEYLQRVAEYVDTKYRELVRQSPSLVPSKVAVLVSINIADELFKQGDAIRRREQDAVARIDGIAALLRREDAA